MAKKKIEAQLKFEVGERVVICGETFGTFGTSKYPDTDKFTFTTIKQVNEDGSVVVEEGYKFRQSYETNLIQYVIDKTEENIDPDIDPDQSILLVDKSIDVLLEKSNNAATNKVEALKAEITKISEDTDMPSLRRIGKLEKKRKTITEVNMVLANQERLLSRLKGIGLRRAHKGIVIQSKKRFPDLLKLNLHKDDSDKHSGNVSIILISIITIIAGFLIITILYSLYK